jgi:hypothetical protein
MIDTTCRGCGVAVKVARLLGKETASRTATEPGCRDTTTGRHTAGRVAAGRLPTTGNPCRTDLRVQAAVGRSAVPVFRTTSAW